MTTEQTDGATPIRVAVVEDDEELGRTLTAFVNRNRDMRCVGAYTSAEAALAGLPDVRPDLVLMDIRLPGMSGIECVARLRTLLPETRAVMLTAYEDTEDVFDSLKAGAFGYLLKSAPPARLREAIRETYRGGSPISGSVARKIVDCFRTPALDADTPDHEDISLSPREEEILRLLAGGHAYKMIAADLDVSINTIRTHIKRIYEKLHVHSRTEAVLRFRGQESGGRQ